METNEIFSPYLEFDSLAIELGQLAALLECYEEHRSRELNELKSANAEQWAARAFLNRRSMGDALLDAITNKLAYIHDCAGIASSKALEAREKRECPA